MRKFLMALPIIVFVLILFLTGRTKYIAFHKAAINGSIKSIHRYGNHVMISVNGVKYMMIPVSLFAAPQFNKIATLGDTVSKRSGSDTLTLIHEGDEAFTFTVKKW